MTTGQFSIIDVLVMVVVLLIIPRCSLVVGTSYYRSFVKFENFYGHGFLVFTDFLPRGARQKFFRVSMVSWWDFEKKSINHGCPPPIVALEWSFRLKPAKIG